jgi:hypothetical protein
MSLGAVEYNDENNHGFKTTSLVLAFQPVARCVTVKYGNFFKGPEQRYEASAETEITVAGKHRIGQYGGELTRNITVPFTYDEVKQLLAEGVKKGATVDFTTENTETLRASLGQQPPQPPKKLNL